MTSKLKIGNQGIGDKTGIAMHIEVSWRGQYVHTSYIAQALYCLVHFESDFTLLMVYSKTVIFSTVDIECSGPVV